MADRAITAASGLTFDFQSHQIWSFPRIPRSKVILSENIDFTCDNCQAVTSVLCSACIWKLNKDAELRLCLGCVASATGCPEVILGPAPRCCETDRLPPVIVDEAAGVRPTVVFLSCPLVKVHAYLLGFFFFFIYSRQRRICTANQQTGLNSQFQWRQTALRTHSLYKKIIQQQQQQQKRTFRKRKQPECSWTVRSRIFFHFRDVQRLRMSKGEQGNIENYR